MEGFQDPFGTLWERPEEPSWPYFVLAVIFIRKLIFAAIYMLSEGSPSNIEVLGHLKILFGTCGCVLGVFLRALEHLRDAKAITKDAVMMSQGGFRSVWDHFGDPFC